jgi:hypothetical protein
MVVVIVVISARADQLAVDVDVVDHREARAGDLICSLIKDDLDALDLCTRCDGRGGA